MMKNKTIKKRLQIVSFVGLLLIIYSLIYLFWLLSYDGIIDYSISLNFFSPSLDVFYSIKPQIFDLFGHVLAIFSYMALGSFYLLSVHELEKKKVYFRHIVLFSSMILILLKFVSFFYKSSVAEMSMENYDFFDFIFEAIFILFLIYLIHKMFKKEFILILEEEPCQRKFSLKGLLIIGTFVLSIAFNHISYEFIYQKQVLLKEVASIRDKKFLSVQIGMHTNKILEILGPPYAKENIGNNIHKWTYLKEIKGNPTHCNRILWILNISGNIVKSVEYSSQASLY